MNKITFSALVLVLAFSTFSFTAFAGDPKPPLPGYKLVWSDEFEGTELDETKWTARVAPIEDAYEDKESCTVKDGALTIQTHTEADGLHHTGFMWTREKFSSTYGYYEASINFRDSPGSWCAFWLVSDGIIPMAAEAKGYEIDIVEHLPGQQTSYPVHVHKWYWDASHHGHDNVGAHAVAAPGSLPLEGNDHVYAVNWTPEGYTFYLNGRIVWATKTFISHESKYILLTCQVVNGSWAGNIPKGGYGDAAHSTTRMKVNYVRVWKDKI